MSIRLRKQSTGLGLVGWIIVSPFILIVSAVLFCEANKAYWDYKVTKMCEEDGGVTVYETVTLDEFDYINLSGSNGSIRIPYFNYSSDIYHPYYRKSHDIKIRESFPEVRKSITVLERRSDNKVLVKAVYYGRRGGDFTTSLFHDSS